MAMKIIDLDTIQANGKRGETQRPAFTKVNDNFADVYAGQDGWRTRTRPLSLHRATTLRQAVVRREG